MTVTAIRCEACDGQGVTRKHVVALDDYSAMTTVSGTCSVCDGTGTERPPQDQDKAAQRHIEETVDE